MKKGGSGTVTHDDIRSLSDGGFLAPIDVHFASFLCKLAGRNSPELALAASLVSRNTREGHVCLELQTVAGGRLSGGDDNGRAVQCPELENWCALLKSSDVVGTPGEYSPLILDGSCRLYLYRYWEYQDKLAKLTNDRIRADIGEYDETILKEGLNRLFPDEETDSLNWRRIAAFMAVARRFCVISGGPGTGKTSTVARILALLIEQEKGNVVRIALVAPTGKAAARLQEVIERARVSLQCSDGIKEQIPDRASTIHRLLGTIQHSPYFRHDDKNLLPVDVVVVDEASMVDLPLMSKLVQAIPLRSRLIILGDKDQLASVEAGAVLGNICDTGRSHTFSEQFCDHLEQVTGYRIPDSFCGESRPGIQDCIVELKRNYRFGRESGIRLVSEAVNSGDGDRAIELLADERRVDISWVTLPAPQTMAAKLRDEIIQGYRDALKGDVPEELFRRFQSFRILCAVREGPYGVNNVNRLAEQILRAEKLIDPSTRWYRGRPIMITRNDYELSLFNGDIGMILPDPQSQNERRAFFQTADGTLRKIHPMRLPEHETVYAMTVHKSQGSEFNRVLLLLPERYSPVLTRELVYTGITRARDSVAIYGIEEVFRATVTRKIERSSGLRDALWT